MSDNIVGSAGARRQLVLLCLASFLFTVGDGSLQLLFPPHLDQRGLAPGTIGLVVAAYSVAALGLRIVAGVVYRADRLRIAVLIGCVGSATAFVLIPRTESVLAWALLSALNGLGFGIASTGGLAAVMELRPGGRSGVIMGWYTGFVGAGYAVAGFLGGRLGDLFGTPTAITSLVALPLLAGAAFGVALVRVGHLTATPRRAPSLAVFRDLQPLVWVSFFVALHISLISGVLNTYFPLYGLTIGLTLTQIGVLLGTHSALGAAVRFFAAPLFRVVRYQRVLPWLVAVGGFSVASMIVSNVYVALLVAWSLLGLARGMLRVASSALVMDSTSGDAGDRGAASGVYLAGLDVGKIVGPLAGGVGIETLGMRATFALTGLAFPTLFVLALLWLRRRPGAG